MRRAEFVLIFAFKKEASAFLQRLKMAEKINVNSLVVYQGQYNELNVDLIFTGCGSNKMKQLNEYVSSIYHEDLKIINLGFVGALSDFYDVGDVVQVGSLFDPNFNTCEVDLQLVNGLPIVRHYTTKDPVESLSMKEIVSKACEADTVDMEASFIASVLGRQISLVKIISDRADQPIKKIVMDNSDFLSKELEKSFNKYFFKNL